MSTTSPLHQALSLCLDRRITFAAFRVPGGPVTLWAQRNPELEPIDPAYLGRLNEAFLVAPFTYEPQATHFVRNDVELTFGELPVSLEPLHGCEGAPPITRAPGPMMPIGRGMRTSSGAPRPPSPRARSTRWWPRGR